MALALPARAATAPIPPAPIPLQTLELSGASFPGLAGPSHLQLLANAKEWARHFLHESRRAEIREEAENAADGFEEGLVEGFRTRGVTRAEYEAQVFAAPRGAVHEVTKWTGEERARDRGHPSLAISHLSGLPDSVVFSEFYFLPEEGVTNVVLADGRCWLHVSAISNHVTQRAQSERPMIALARRIATRFTPTCA